MSDHKKVIHVKDLVIKADNVHIEPTRPRRNPFFFGPRVREERDRYEESADKEDVHDKESSDVSSEDKGDRRPFSWI